MMPLKEKELPRRIGPYEVVGFLGEGAMGQVYKAVQPSLNRMVAVKVLPAELAQDEKRVERFDREAQAVALLNHPNVVQIIDKNRDGDLLYFVMEYVPGSALDQLLRQRRLSLQEALGVFRGVLEGLSAAHAQGVIHRDLNPRNILVSEDLSTVKIADFGISRVESISLEMGTLSTGAMTLGSLHYMSPEQAMSLDKVDERSDIYSAGVVLYEMLTGRLPVGRFSLPSELNSEVPPEFDPIVLKCLASDAADRYQNVRMLSSVVRAVEDQLRLGLVRELRGISRSTSKMLRKSTQSIKVGPRSRATLGLAGVVVVLAAGLLWWWLAGRSPQPEAGAIEGEAPIEVSAVAPYAGMEGGEGAEASLGRLELPPVPPAENAAASQSVEKPSAKPSHPPSPSLSHNPQPASPRPVAATPTVATSVTSELASEDLQVAEDKLAAKLYGPALTDLQTFIEDHPDSPLVPQAYLLISRAHQAQDRANQAMAALVEVRSRFEGSPQAAEAGYRLAGLLLASDRKAKLREAVELYGEVAERFPRSEWAPKALLAKVELEEEERTFVTDAQLKTRVPTSLVTQRAFVERYPTRPEAETLFWNLAHQYDDLKRYDLAAATYADLGRRFPKTRYDAWWEAGQIYDKRLDATGKAIESYAQVPATSSRHSAAQKRLKKLSP